MSSLNPHSGPKLCSDLVQAVETIKKSKAVDETFMALKKKEAFKASNSLFRRKLLVWGCLHFIIVPDFQGSKTFELGSIPFPIFISSIRKVNMNII